MGLMEKVKDLSDFLPSVNMLVYGDSGVGKTVLGGSDESALIAAPEDDGVISAIRQGSRAKGYTIKRWEDLMQLHTDLVEFIEEDGEEFPFKWLVIDSITEMQDMCMKYILRRVVAENSDRDPDIPAIQDWQRYYIMFDKMVRAFNDLPINVLYTALAKKVEDADGNEFMVPEIQGKDYGIAMKTVSLMTTYGYMMREVVEEERPVDSKEPDGEKKKVKVRKRVIYFEDNGVYRGKDRTAALGTKYVLPPKNALKSIRLAIENFGTEPPKKAAAKKAVKAAPTKAAPAKVAEAKAQPAKASGPKLTGEVGQKFDKPIGVASADGNHERPDSEPDLESETAEA